MNACVLKVGDVSEVMDKGLGRLVYRICGPISANNYVLLDNLHITGRYLLLQLAIHGNGVASIHIEVVTKSRSTIRISLSTLYDNDQPRFFGRSLRLPLPMVPSWSIVAVDLHSVVQKLCNSDPTSVNLVQADFVKRIQVCSNILLRDIVSTTEAVESVEALPKELSVKPQGASLQIFDVVDYSLSSPSKRIAAARKARVIPSESQSPRPQLSASMRSPSASTAVKPAQVPSPVHAERQAEASVAAPETPLVVQDNRANEALSPPVSSTPVGPAKEELVAVKSPEGTVPCAMTARENLLRLDRVLGYNGGPVVLLYNGRMMVFAVGVAIAMVDLKSHIPKPQFGLWKAFAPNPGSVGEHSHQSFLKGHSENISLIEVSHGRKYLATGEADCDHGLIILWSLEEGKRVASLRPCRGKLSCFSFSEAGTQLITVGLDNLGRQQLIVWEISTLLLAKGVVDAAAGDAAAIVAKQISEYSVVTICRCPWDASGVISCGRENIRLWRTRKGHLPGRPIVLNRYSRDITFTCIDVESAVQRSSSTGAFFYVGSNKGLLLKVDYKSEQVVCAFQLHSSAILSFRIHNGYAVSGGEDKRFRIWPLDFSDYLLEARHEGAVSSAFICEEGKLVAIGTRAGTLGILTVSEHSYRTVLRSHTGQVRHICLKQDGTEAITVSGDYSIRCWNLKNGQQTLEFLAEDDEPTCACLAPWAAVLVCGFVSGTIRLFDTTTAKIIQEIRLHTGSICQLQCVQTNTGQQLLVSGDSNGRVFVSDGGNGFRTVFSLDVPVSSEASLHFAFCSATSTLLIGADSIESMVFVSTATWLNVRKMTDIMAEAFSGSSLRRKLGDHPLKLDRAEGGKLLAVAPVGNSHGVLAVTDRHIFSLWLDPASFSMASKKHSIESATGACISTETGAVILTLSLQETQRPQRSESLPRKASNALAALTVRVTMQSGLHQITLTAPQHYPSSGAGMVSVAHGQSIAITGDQRGFLSFWRVAALGAWSSDLADLEELQESPHQRIIEAANDCVIIDGTEPCGLVADFAPAPVPTSAPTPAPATYEDMFGDSEVHTPEPPYTENAFSDSALAGSAEEYLTTQFHLEEQSAAAEFMAQYGSASSEKETEAAADEVSLHDAGGESETGESSVACESHASANLSKIENDFLVSMETMLMKDPSLSSVQGFSRACFSRASSWRSALGSASAFSTNSTAIADCDGQIVSCRFSQIGWGPSGKRAVLASPTTVAVLDTATLERVPKKMGISEQGKVLSIVAVAISSCESWIAAVCNESCASSGAVSIRLLVWSADLDSDCTINAVVCSDVGKAANSSVCKVVFLSPTQVAITHSHADGLLYIHLADFSRSPSTLQIRVYRAPPCGSSVQGVYPCRLSADVGSSMWLCGSSSRYLLSFSGADGELVVAWKDELKPPVQFWGAVSNGSWSSNSDADLLFALDSRGFLHTTYVLQSDGKVVVRTSSCLLATHMAGKDTSRVYLSAAGGDRNRFYVGLCSASELQVFRIRMDVLSARSIKVSSTLLAKSRPHFPPFAVQLLGCGDGVVGVVASREGQFSWQKFADQVQPSSTPFQPLIGSAHGECFLLCGCYNDRDGHPIMLGVARSKLLLVDLSTRIQNELPLNDCRAASLSRNGRWLLAGLANGQLLLFETHGMRQIDSMMLGDEGNLRSSAKSESIIQLLKTSSYLKRDVAVHMEESDNTPMEVFFVGSSSEQFVARWDDQVVSGHLIPFPKDSSNGEAVTARISHSSKRSSIAAGAYLVEPMFGADAFIAEALTTLVNVTALNGTSQKWCVDISRLQPPSKEGTPPKVQMVPVGSQHVNCLVVCSNRSVGFAVVPSEAATHPKIELKPLPMQEVLGTHICDQYLAVLTPAEVNVIDLHSLVYDGNLRQVFSICVADWVCAGAFGGTSQVWLHKAGDRFVVVVHESLTATTWLFHSSTMGK